MPAVVPVAPHVTRENVDWTLARMAERVGNEYVYGGQFSADDIDQGCDCSALVAFICNGVLYGDAATWRRVDGATGAWITTESWRPVEVGELGPFGSICVASPADIPADAAVRIALHHGPGGGVASHTWCEVDGHRFESNGSRGCITGDDALPIDASYANDWAYIPGPIDAPGDVELGLGARGPAVIALQIGMARVFPAYAADLTPPIGPTGVYDERTADAVAEFQRRRLLPATGLVDGRTAAELHRYGVTWSATAYVEPEPVPAALVTPPEPTPVTDTDPARPASIETAGLDKAPHHALLDTIVTALGELARLLDTPPRP